MSRDLMLYYRGPLHSCNYACTYCPFAKTKDSADSLAVDAEKLARFTGFIERHPNHRFRILFTPWGEALIRGYYRDAMLRLSHLPQVVRVAAQTNLSVDPVWAQDADRDAFSLWCTYHPSQVDRDTFLNRCHTMDRLGLRYSVGMVGLKEDLPAIEAMREALPRSVYLWVNAYKREPRHYDEQMRARLRAVDPHFNLNNQYHPSFGESCRAGDTALMIDGEGTMHRCHFVKTPIGNLYDPDWEKALMPRTCPNPTCGCYIGYVHLSKLKLQKVYGDGLMERIPAAFSQNPR